MSQLRTFAHTADIVLSNSLARLNGILSIVRNEEENRRRVAPLLQGVLSLESECLNRKEKGVLFLIDRIESFLIEVNGGMIQTRSGVKESGFSTF